MTEMQIARRIESRTARIAIIGQGYVGLPLAVAFARAGFSVKGVDVDLDRVGTLNAGSSYSPDVCGAELVTLLAAGRYGVESVWYRPDAETSFLLHRLQPA